MLAEALAAVGETEEHFWEAAELYQLREELRAAMSLCRLWQQGQRGTAREFLAEVYGWFTDGLDTAD